MDGWMDGWAQKRKKKASSRGVIRAGHMLEREHAGKCFISISGLTLHIHGNKQTSLPRILSALSPPHRGDSTNCNTSSLSGTAVVLYVAWGEKKVCNFFLWSCSHTENMI